MLSLRFLPGLVNNRSLCSKVVRKHRDAIMLRSSTSERNVMGRNDTVYVGSVFGWIESLFTAITIQNQ